MHVPFVENPQLKIIICQNCDMDIELIPIKTTILDTGCVLEMLPYKIKDHLKLHLQRNKT